MFGIDFKFVDTSKAVAKASDDATFKNFGHAAAGIRKTAIASIQPGDGPSTPGTPPHTHTQKVTKSGKTRAGVLPKSITFKADKEGAVIGPRESIVGEAGAAHEFGEEFRGDDYPERPFMGPALEANLARFASSWQAASAHKELLICRSTSRVSRGGCCTARQAARPVR